MALVIGLGSRARQGKDTVAAAMQGELPERVQRFSFARALKQYCRDHHDELLVKWQIANQCSQIPLHKIDPIYGCTAILQWWGVEMRKKDPNYWVDIVAKQIAMLPEDAIAVITDVRFPNEAEWVKSQGGALVRVLRLHSDNSVYTDPLRAPHISESALDDYGEWNYLVLAKSGDTDALYTAASTVLFEALECDSVKYPFPRNRIVTRQRPNVC